MVAVVAAALLVGAAAGLWLALNGASSREARTVGHHQRRLPAWITPWTLVATVQGPTSGYPNPDAPNPAAIVFPTWASAPSALPVLASQPGWIEVSLVAPPAKAPTTWIRSANASLTRTPYRVVVDLSRTRLLLFRDAKLVLCAPAAVGTTQNPTPLGHYFVALLARAPSLTYGPFVIVTSAFANTITDWQQSGRPTITIEGPLDSAAAIGTSGAPITTGSIRLLDRDLDQLRGVPTGSPIDIVATLPLPPPAKRPPRHHGANENCA